MVVSNEKCWYYCFDENDKAVCSLDREISNCYEECPYYKQMYACFRDSGLPNNYWYPFGLKNSLKDKEAYDELKQIKTDLQQFTQEGKNLLIRSSNCGNGKTSWAIKLLQRNIELNFKCVYQAPPSYFVYLPTLCVEARKAISQPSNLYKQMENALENSPLVVIDDIGSIPIRDYDLLILSHFVDTRLRKGLSTIYTTNCTDEEIELNLDKRLCSRICKASKVIEFQSKGLRGDND